MKERPIIFSAPMVRTILGGQKTQTRRPVKPVGAHEIFAFIGRDDRPTGEFGWCSSPRYVTKHIHCPYGQPGDRLWVRETWQAWTEFNNVRADAISAEGRLRLNYPADGNTWNARIRRSIHMPRWASRITLEITNVRVERLQNISDEDAIADGIEQVDALNGTPLWRLYGKEPWNTVSPIQSYQSLWQSIYGAASWSDPWVWVIEFRRLP